MRCQVTRFGRACPEGGRGGRARPARSSGLTPDRPAEAHWTLYYIILHYIILYYAIYRITLYYIILHCIMLYYRTGRGGRARPARSSGLADPPGTNTGVHIYIYIYTYMNNYIYIYIYIYTHE